MNKIYFISQNELNKNDIQWIKDISYNIEKYNITDFYKELLCILIINPKYTNNLKFEIIKLFSESEYNYNRSYHSLIHIESFFIHLINCKLNSTDMLIIIPINIINQLKFYYKQYIIY